MSDQSTDPANDDQKVTRKVPPSEVSALLARMRAEESAHELITTVGLLRPELLVAAMPSVDSVAVRVETREPSDVIPVFEDFEEELEEELEILESWPIDE